MALLTVSSASPCPASDPLPGKEAAAAPNPQDIVKAGKATADRLASGAAAAWTVEFRGKQGGLASIDVVSSGGNARWSVRTDIGGKQTELYRIIVRDGLWYLFQNDKPVGKYRPYEAPLPQTPDYYYITKTDPLVAVDAEGIGRMKYDHATGGVATYYAQVTGEQRRVAEDALRFVEEAEKAHPEAKPDDARAAERQSKTAVVKEMLEKGVAYEIDLKSGMFLSDPLPLMPKSLSE